MDSQEEDLISIKEAAGLLGVSPRRVYGLLEKGRLPYTRGHRETWLKRQDVLSFHRTAPGRTRWRVPRWSTPSRHNKAYVTSITVPVRAGAAQLEERLSSFCKGNVHAFPGTAQRYVSLDSNSELLQITLIWRAAVMPHKERQEMLLDEMKAALEDLDWNRMSLHSGRILIMTLN